ncbi:MAG TPA: transcription antitermination factor NusB, partial [Thermoanaerobaculia bacterium]|nr:transcription antitermination factor NusB [Thermoanaerobaculia bacterium]
WKSALDDEIAGMCRVSLSKLAPNLREILEVALYQARHLDRIPAYAAVSEAVDLARGSGGEGAARLVNGVLRGVLLLPPPKAPEAGGGAAALARHFSHPAFLVERWLARFGPDRTRAILEADNEAPRLDLLVNPRRGTRDALREGLAREGVAAEPSPIAPLALTVRSGSPLRTRAFAEGRFSIQDVGSQLLPLLLPEGDLLVDLAAAPGGKSLSAIAHGRARRALALDRSWGRLLRVAENGRRLGVSEVRPVAADVAAAPLPGAAFDRVLLDAPCSGTGTLRKNPEIRYRVTPEAIDRLARAQVAALAASAALLATGGYLLYATCSLEEEENERVVDAVVGRAPELERAPIAAPAGLEPFVDGARLRLFPDASTDGFTAHLLRRRPA